jgi:hypothetical protein
VGSVACGSKLCLGLREGKHRSRCEGFFGGVESGVHIIRPLELARFWLASQGTEERPHQSSCAGEEAIVEVDHADKLLESGDGGWSRERPDSINFVGQRSHSRAGNAVAKEVDLRLAEDALS